ncbi:hypothetical protein GALL_172310 [mine drainage metagenome]|uniref:Uncharacterized protein n=1 Tax=mine drainage metagenome TaxID=410659 RepID=A0A1J5RY00_9ZZZZ
MLYLFKFSFVIIRFGLSLVLVRKKAKQDAIDYLHRMEESLDGKFDDATFKKVIKSHSVFLPIVNNAFTLLHGRTTNAVERERSINYFICSSIFDNFFDDKLLPVDQIESLTFQPKQFIPSTFDERVFLQAHLFLLNGMKDTKDYFVVLRKEFDAQAASMQQFDEKISNEQIKHITFEKGGNAVLMCRYYLDTEPTKQEEECWYQLGTMIQLSNDLFDIYKDLQQNIQTLAVRCTDAYSMEKFFLEQVNDIKKNIATFPYSSNRKLTFSISMAATYVLGLTAIDQLKRLQGKSATLPMFKTLPRKALIVDMEKPANILRWIKFVYQHGKLLPTSIQVS